MMLGHHPLATTLPRAADTSFVGRKVGLPSLGDGEGLRRSPARQIRDNHPTLLFFLCRESSAMTSIGASTTHKVGGAKKTTTKANGSSGGILKSSATSKIKPLPQAATNGNVGKPALQRRGSAPMLQPSTLLSSAAAPGGGPSPLDIFLSLPPADQKDRILTEFLPAVLGERAIFKDGIATPHTASTTQSRGKAACDLAILVSKLGPVVVFKKFGVLLEIEKALLPEGIAAVFGNGPGMGVHPGGGMRRITSTVSMASAMSGTSSNGGDLSGMDLSGMSISGGTGTSTVMSDSKRGKLTPPNAREGALLFLRALCELSTKETKRIEPYVVPLLAAALDECGSSSGPVREAASDAAEAVLSIVNPRAVPGLVVPVVFEALRSPEWRVKSSALERLVQIAERAPRQISKLLPEIVPTVTGQMWDTKPQVTKAATAALLAVCVTNDNPDIRPAIPAVVHAVSKPADTYKAVEELMATTFVATVDASTLAILCPILSRGLKEKNAIRKRACCVVIENMSRLVDSPSAVAPFGPLLVPELKRVVENVQFEDIRDIALSALQALTRALGHDDVDSAMASIMRAEAEKAEEEQRRIAESQEEVRRIEEEYRLKEEEERKRFREAMDAQRLLDNLALEEEARQKEKAALKREAEKLSTKGASGKCQGCGLKKCTKSCLFNKN